MSEVVCEVIESTMQVSDGARHHDLSVFPNDIAWFRLLETHVLKGSACIRIWMATKDDHIVAMPMLRRYNDWLGGVRLEALQNYYSPDYRPICNSEQATELINRLIAEIDRQSRTNRVALSPMDVDSPELAALIFGFEQARWRHIVQPSTINWVHQVDGDYEHYLASRSARVRNTLKRKQQRLAKLGNVDIRVHSDVEDLQSLSEHYNHVYEQSWKAAEPYPEFIPALIRHCGDRGELRLGTVTIDDQPVAVHFWIVSGGVASIYKLAHVRAYDRYSPGTVLMAEMLRHVIDIDRVNVVDFLTGDDAYKQDWMSERRQKVEIVAYRVRSFQGLIAFLLEQRLRPAVSRLKSRFKRVGLHSLGSRSMLSRPADPGHRVKRSISLAPKPVESSRNGSRVVG